MILPCTCQHAYQDKTYGKGMRIHNLCKSSKSDKLDSGARCTVCSNVKSIG